MSKLPDDTILVDENRRIVRVWLGVMRSLLPATSFSQAFVDALVQLSPADIAVLQQLILAASVPVPDVPVVPPYSVDFQSFTASGLWVKPSFGSIARICGWGTGGSGAARGGGNASGGGGGPKIELWLPLVLMGDTELWTPGTPGAGVSGTSNGIGGTASTFGALLNIPGGGGGITALINNAAAGGFGAGVTSGSTGVEATAGTSGKKNADYRGGGAPGGGCSSGNISSAGGDAFSGGAGGGGVSAGDNAEPGGTSVEGGNGGAAADGSDGVAGSPKGGGGGATIGGTSGAGGDAYLEVTVF